MKFADKYELSDAVTSGRLETFMGRDVSSGEPVLVHIFDAPVKKPDQPTVLWVLESFRAVAPEAPGLVIAAGKYGATSYAYLVTRVPDEAALRKWTQAYELSTAETREIPIERQAIAPENPPAALLRPNPVEPIPPSISQMSSPPTGFFEMRPPRGIDEEPAKGAARLPSTPEEKTGNNLDGVNFGPLQDAPRREPGDFTKQFFAGSNALAPPPANELQLNQAPFKSATPPDRMELANPTGIPGPSSNPADGALPDLGGFTALFRTNLKAATPEVKDSAKRIDSARKVDEAKAGDFTKFFQGPFDGERPADIPDVLPNASSTPRRNLPGEFTQMFGSSKDSPFAGMSSSVDPVVETPLRNEPGTFTRSFADAGQLSSTTEPPAPSLGTKGNGSLKPPTFPEPSFPELKWTPAIPSPVETPVSTPEPPVVPNVLRESRPSIPGGATQLFSVPGGHTAPSSPPPPSGPSEYTRIISGGMAGLRSTAEEPIKDEAPAEAGGLPAFKMPAAAVPKAPKLAAPPPPKLPAAPAAPKLPALGALAPKPKASNLPMIIILNVSLIVAVLLIVYFAIKH